MLKHLYLATAVLKHLYIASRKGRLVEVWPTARPGTPERGLAKGQTGTWQSKALEGFAKILLCKTKYIMRMIGCVAYILCNNRGAIVTTRDTPGYYPAGPQGIPCIA